MSLGFRLAFDLLDDLDFDTGSDSEFSLDDLDFDTGSDSELSLDDLDFDFDTGSDDEEDSKLTQTRRSLDETRPSWRKLKRDERRQLLEDVTEKISYLLKRGKAPAIKDKYRRPRLPTSKEREQRHDRHLVHITNKGQFVTPEMLARHTQGLSPSERFKEAKKLLQTTLPAEMNPYILTEKGDQTVDDAWCRLTAWYMDRLYPGWRVKR